ncbi:MAG TPA: nucleotidyltransferase family protein [Bryobacteraceae bacterium]|nr:nucleotidyltransferase family protein [Bryobacteraceae bacterium]
MNATLPIAIPQQAIAAFCERNHMRKLSLFGSVLTDRFSAHSDIDILVEFDPAHIPGLFELSGMEPELSEILGRRVDLRTPGELSRCFRANVVASAVPQYERVGRWGRMASCARL